MIPAIVRTRHGQKSLFVEAPTFLSHPLLRLSTMSSFLEPGGQCRHQPTWVGRVAVVGCAQCAEVDWLSDSGAIDPSEAMAQLFGMYELTGSIDALGAPSPQALVYRPPSSRKRKNLDAFPRNTWMKCGPQLWMSTDGEHLLLATPHRVMFDNLMRGA